MNCSLCLEKQAVFTYLENKLFFIYFKIKLHSLMSTKNSTHLFQNQITLICLGIKLLSLI